MGLVCYMPGPGASSLLPMCRAVSRGVMLVVKVGDFLRNRLSTLACCPLSFPYLIFRARFPSRIAFPVASRGEPGSFPPATSGEGRAFTCSFDWPLLWFRSVLGDPPYRSPLPMSGRLDPRLFFFFFFFFLFFFSFFFFQGNTTTSLSCYISYACKCPVTHVASLIAPLVTPHSPNPFFFPFDFMSPPPARMDLLPFSPGQKLNAFLD